MKMHARSIRLAVNAGMTFPACAANARLLDLDKARWPIGTPGTPITCRKCIRILRAKGTK